MVGFEVGSLVYMARNNLARQAIKAEADWVLWLDSDMVFAPDFLQRMLTVCKENDIDFLTALCFRRKPPYTPTLFDKLERTEKGASYTALMSVPEGRFQVGGCGMAGVLMSTDVLLSVAAKFNGRMFDPFEGFGEDVIQCFSLSKPAAEQLCLAPELFFAEGGVFIFQRQDLVHDGLDLFDLPLGAGAEEFIKKSHSNLL